jgi:hypothetical protein
MRSSHGKDSFRPWTGVRKVRDVTVGETHSERATRRAMARLRRQMAVEQAIAVAKPENAG